MAEIISSAMGRRKTAVARVNLLAGSGKAQINRKEPDIHIPSEALRPYMLQPLKIAGVEEKDVQAFVKVEASPVKAELFVTL